MHDVIIVGAGAVGLYLSSLLKGLDVVVIDKSGEMGKKADSGLYSTNIKDFFEPQEEWVEHEVSAARLHSPSGEVIELRKPSTAAYVVDREKFTKWLASRAAGDIRLNTTVRGIEIGDSVSVRTDRGVLESKMVIGCDGANSVVRSHFGEKPSEILGGIIAVVKGENLEDSVDLFFDKERIRDGFFWKIPRGDSTEYGALGMRVTYRTLEEFFGIKDYEKRAAFMSLGLIKTAFARSLLVGEAACQVKPWSCGGIVYGFTCADIASNVIKEAFERQDFSEGFLMRYDEMWKKKLGRAIKLGMLFRSKLKESDNAKLEKYFKWGRRLGFLNKLDMDFPKVGFFE